MLSFGQFDLGLFYPRRTWYLVVYVSNLYGLQNSALAKKYCWPRTSPSVVISSLSFSCCSCFCAGHLLVVSMLVCSCCPCASCVDAIPVLVSMLVMFTPSPLWLCCHHLCAGHVVIISVLFVLLLSLWWLCCCCLSAGHFVIVFMLAVLSTCPC